MTYIDQASAALVAALAEHCGKDEDAGITMSLFDVYLLLVLTSGEDVTPKQVHDVWAIAEWYTRPDHRSIVPFDQLAPEVQALDQPFVDAIQAAARALKVGSSR